MEKRVSELDREWDIERLLEANAASIILTGLALGLRDRRFLAIPAIVAGFLLEHAVQGWCPPLTLFRKMGVRTNGEIMREKSALLNLKT